MQHAVATETCQWQVVAAGAVGRREEGQKEAGRKVGQRDPAGRDSAGFYGNPWNETLVLYRTFY